MPFGEGSDGAIRHISSLCFDRIIPALRRIAFPKHHQLPVDATRERTRRPEGFARWPATTALLGQIPKQLVDTSRDRLRVPLSWLRRVARMCSTVGVRILQTD